MALFYFAQNLTYCTYNIENKEEVLCQEKNMIVL